MPSFQAIGPMVLEDKIFLRFFKVLSIFEHDGHLSHVTMTINSFYPKLVSYEIHIHLALLFVEKNGLQNFIIIFQLK